MDRRSFLKLFGGGALAASVAPGAIIVAVEPVAEAPERMGMFLWGDSTLSGGGYTQLNLAMLRLAKQYSCCLMAPEEDVDVPLR